MRQRWLRSVGLGLGLFCGLWLAGAAEVAPRPAPRYRTDRILVMPRVTRGIEPLRSQHAARGMKVLREFPRLGHLQVLGLPEGATVAATIADYQDSGLVEYAEPDYTIHAALEPNDPSYINGALWGLKNTGQSSGRAGVDIGAATAWGLTHDAGTVVVAIIDSGIRATHQDLAANLWINPGEVAGNGVDDDADRYADDIYGIDAITSEGSPVDDLGHGTHVAGIIGAVGNNGIGVTGVAWKVRLMALKFLDNAGDGATSDAIVCIDYARQKGAHLINASWGDAGYSLSLYNAIARARDDGIIFVAAAANSGKNNDLTPNCPSSYPLDNIVAVGAIDRSGNIPSFSNYGARSVHLMAPGKDINSTWYTSDTAYASESGTSMATPYVTGALALLKARYPGENYRQLIARLLANTQPLASASGKCLTGGMVNVAAALQATTVASFDASALVGAVPMDVGLTNTSVGDIAGLAWDFGDGSSLVTEANPQHRYRAEGRYGIALTVTNRLGETSTVRREVTALVNYQIQATNYAWINPSNLTRLTWDSTDISAAQPIPFPFAFYGTINTQLFVGINGIIGFSADDLDASNQAFPHTQPPHKVICPYWVGLRSSSGAVYAGTIGEAPNRRMVVSWAAVPLQTLAAVQLTFQVILSEGSPNVHFQYREVYPGNSGGGGRWATVGLENDTGTVFSKYSYNKVPAKLTNSQALAFVPMTPSGQAPTVAITGPTNGALFTAPASFSIAATASAFDSAPARVEFLAGTNLLGAVTNSPYTWIVTSLPAGSYRLTARAIDSLGGATVSDPVAITVDQPPTVTVTRPSDGARYSAPAAFTLEATATDSDGRVAGVEWYQGTTRLGVVANSPFGLAVTDLAVGAYTFRAKAVDDLGAATTSLPITVTVVGPPTVAITGPTNGALFTAPASFSIAATASAFDSAPARVEFLAGTNLLGAVTNSPYTWIVTSLPAGSYRLTARAIDSLGGATVSDPVAITVDQPPTVTVTRPSDGARYSAPAAFTLEATATDSDGRVAGVEWYQGTTRLGVVANSPFGLAVTDLAVGAYTFRAKAVDDLGAATTSLPITVTVVGPPTVAITGPTNGALFTAPASFSIAAAASAFDSAPARVEFLAGTNLLGAVTNSPYTWIVTSLPAGSYRLTARAIDSLGGATVSDPVAITVDQPPTVTVTRPSDGARYSAPAAFTLEATATDSDGRVAGVEWYQGTTRLGVVANSPFGLAVTDLAVGAYTFRAKAVDDLGAATTSLPITVTVVGPPTVAITGPTNGALFIAPASFSIAAAASAFDSAPARVEFLAGTNLLGAVTNSPYTWIVTSLPAGSYRLTARAIDSLGGATVSDPVAITVDQPPTVTVTRPSDGARYSAPAAFTARGDGDGQRWAGGRGRMVSGNHAAGSGGEQSIWVGRHGLGGGRLHVSREGGGRSRGGHDLPPDHGHGGGAADGGHYRPDEWRVVHRAGEFLDCGRGVGIRQRPGAGRVPGRDQSAGGGDEQSVHVDRHEPARGQLSSDGPGHRQPGGGDGVRPRGHHGGSTADSDRDTSQRWRPLFGAGRVHARGDSDGQRWAGGRGRMVSGNHAAGSGGEQSIWVGRHGLGGGRLHVSREGGGRSRGGHDLPPDHGHGGGAADGGHYRPDEWRVVHRAGEFHDCGRGVGFRQRPGAGRVPGRDQSAGGGDEQSVSLEREQSARGPV